MSHANVVWLLIACFIANANAFCETQYGGHSGKFCSFLRSNIMSETCTAMSFTTNVTGTGPIKAFNGLTEDPFTRKIYAVVSVNAANNPRDLVEVVNVTSGQVRYIANVGLSFASISFACDGNLYGITGKMGNDPSTLFRISVTDGSKTKIKAFTNGNKGNALAYDFDNGFLYRAGTIAGSVLGLQKIDINANFSTMNYNVTGISPNVGAMAYEGNNKFWIADANKPIATLYSVGVMGGAATKLGTFPNATTGRKGFVCVNHTVASCATTTMMPQTTTMMPQTTSNVGRVGLVGLSVLVVIYSFVFYF